MESIAKIIIKKSPVTKTTGIQHEWQAFAYKVWKEFSNNPKEMSNAMRFFKKYNEGYRSLLDEAYNFTVDYTGPIPKMRLFYWKFWKEKKSLDQKGMN